MPDLRVRKNYDWENDCDNVLVQTCSYGCYGACNPPPEPVFDFAAISLLVQKGGTVKVVWNTATMQSCTITGSNGDSWTGLTSGTVSGSCTSSSQCSTGYTCLNSTCVQGKTSATIQGQTIYTARCIAEDDSILTKSTTVNIIPVFCEPGAGGCTP
jgi:hypothetical protein